MSNRRTRKDAAKESACYIDRNLNTLYLAGDVTLQMASKFRRLFRSLDRPGVETVTVEINTPGGDESAGFMIMDTIIGSRCNVITRATGMTMSMGTMILLVGDTREALPFANLMVHQGSFYLRARMEEADNEINELKRNEELCWHLMDTRTNKPAGYWKALCSGKNKYLNAREALEQGLIDQICE
jgi:ATP-dependent protease ClpP protease subunit